MPETALVAFIDALAHPANLNDPYRAGVTWWKIKNPAHTQAGTSLRMLPSGSASNRLTAGAVLAREALVTIDLTDEERLALINLLTVEIEQSRFPLSPRIHRLKAIREKLRPGSPRPPEPSRSKGSFLSAAGPLSIASD